MKMKHETFRSSRTPVWYKTKTISLLLMSKDPKRKGPSLELQRQIDESIAARHRSNATSSALSGSAEASLAQTSASEAGSPAPGAQYEYLDHPADIILHSWGSTLSQSLCNLAICMFGYMTSIESITINNQQSIDHGRDIITATGHDLHSLIFAYLDEWLFNFHDTGFIPKVMEINELSTGNNEKEEEDGASWRIASSGKGEIMDIKRHPQGTEVKAVTYNGMSVVEQNGRVDIYVVVDI